MWAARPPPWPHLSSSGNKLSGAELTKALPAFLRTLGEALSSSRRAAAMKSELSGGPPQEQRSVLCGTQEPGKQEPWVSGRPGLPD